MASKLVKANRPSRRRSSRLPTSPPPRLAVAATLAATLLATTPAAARHGDPAVHVDRASACQREGDWSCALSESDAALESMAAQREGSPAPRAPGINDVTRRLRRQILIVRAEALARLGRAPEAARAYRRVLRVWPGWSPPPDAPPAVRQAFRQGRLDGLRASLPSRLPLPAPPIPSPATWAALAPPPLLYAPTHLVKLDPEAARVRRWSLAMGGGVALLAGGARAMFAHGALASLELSVLVSPRYRLTLGADLSLHDFGKDFRPEPGYGRGLTTVAFTAGVMADVPLGAGFEGFAATAVGGGMFGVRSVAERSGIALRALLGARYWITTTLAARLDGGVQATFPLGRAPSAPPHAAAHGTLTVRVEARF